MRKVLILLILSLMILGAEVFADDIKFEAAVDKKTVAIGESAQLGLTFYGTQNVPAPDIGNIDGCEVRYLGPSTMMTVINGTVSNSITHMYKVQPLRLGKFQLGPFTFKYEGNTYTSSIAFLTATEEKTRQEPAKKEDEENIIDSLDIKDRLFLTLKIDRTTAYVNEIVPITIKVYVNRMNVSDIQLPTFNQEGFSKAQFEDPKQYRERMGGLLYDVLEFRTTIFGSRAGDYKLGPATLKCNLAVKKRVRNMSALDDDFLNDRGVRDPYFEDFFTRYERYPVELKSDEANLVLLALPQEGRPEDFSGAVGDYQFIYSAGPKKVKVGDPVTLKMEINGTGNFNTVIIPKLENTEGFRVYESQIKTEAGRKTFRQVLIPESDKVYQTPKAIFTYFDPEKKMYKTITQEPAPLQVEKILESPAQVIGQAPGSPSTTPLNFERPPEEKREDSQPQGDILYIKESMGRVQKRGSEVYKNIFFLVIFLAPFLILIVVYLIYAKQDRLRRDTKYAHRTEAFKSMHKEFFELKRRLKSNDSKGFYETLFKAIQDYLGGRLYIPVAGLTFDTVEPVLRSKGVGPETLNKIKNIFSVCDRAKFALINADTLLMKDDMKFLEEIIRELERYKI
ncbi:MAG: BatD family protein [Candidatus Omnitrophica bacterium]|nr:BatD family protein [Candidatus Omnitrophota bacterium]